MKQSWVDCSWVHLQSIALIGPKVFVKIDFRDRSWKLRGLKVPKKCIFLSLITQSLKKITESWNQFILYLCQCIASGVNSSPVCSQRGDSTIPKPAAQDTELAATVCREVAKGQPGGLPCWQEAPSVGHKLNLLYKIAGVVFPRHLHYGLAVKQSHVHSVGAFLANNRSPAETVLQLKTGDLVVVLLPHSDSSNASLSRGGIAGARATTHGHGEGVVINRILSQRTDKQKRENHKLEHHLGISVRFRMFPERVLLLWRLLQENGFTL